MSEFYERYAKTPVRQTWPWLIVASVVIVVISFLTASSGLTNSSSDNHLAWAVGAALGGAFFWTAIVWLVLNFAILRRSGRDVGAKYFFILFLVSAATGFAGGYVNAVPIAASQGSQEAAIKKLAAVGQSDSQAYVAAMAELGFDEVLRPSRLATDRSMTKARQTVAKARVLTLNQAALVDRRAQEARAELAAKPGITPETLKTFDVLLEEMRPGSAKMWELQLARIDETDAVLQLLANSGGTWSARDGDILFTRSAELESYRAHMSEIEHILTQQRKIQSGEITMISKDSYRINSAP